MVISKYYHSITNLNMIIL